MLKKNIAIHKLCTFTIEKEIGTIKNICHNTKFKTRQTYPTFLYS